MKKYPLAIREYLQSTGKLLEHRVSQVFQELGFQTWIAYGQSNGVDLVVKDREGNLVLVAEILNWCPYSELSHDRKRGIISNLTEYNCSRLLIYTTSKNESYLLDLSNFGISLLKIGFQVLPISFLKHFARNNKIEQRRADSRETKQLLRSRIQQYLESMGDSS